MKTDISSDQTKNKNKQQSETTRTQTGLFGSYERGRATPTEKTALAEAAIEVQRRIEQPFTLRMKSSSQ